LISDIIDVIFGDIIQGTVGAMIDVFAIVITLFGTAASLGLGAVQIGPGVEIVSGVGKVGNAFIIGVIAVLTVAFIISAVSGVKRGIRLLSNTNMLVAGFLAIFVFVAGPTMFILNFLPAAFLSFF